MVSKIFSALKVRPDERERVVIMLALGFFIGVFITTYQITADSLFLSRQAHRLNEAFLISGLLGMISTALFAVFQSRLKFSFLSFVNTLVVVSIVVLLYVALHKEELAYLSDQLIFGMYCFTGTITALLLLTYWGLFARMFDFGQSKRIIGWIDTGQLSAAILASLLIPATESFFPDPTDYLFFCGISMAASGLLVVYIALRFKLTGNSSAELSKEVRRDSSFIRMFKDRYVVLLSVFLSISMVTFMFTQFSFQEMVGIQYPNERELANFLAYFSLAIQIMALIMQTFVNERIISNYGLKVPLFILPIVVLIFVASSIFIALSFGYDKVASPQGFLFYFLFVSLGRLFNVMLRDSLESPTYKLFFIPLDNRVRFNIQAKIEGVINETARFIAGVLIFVLPMIPFFDTIYILIAVVFLLGGYFIIGNRLHIGYKSKIRSKLENLEFEHLESTETEVENKLLQVISDAKASAAVFAFKLLEKMAPASVSTWVNSLIRNHDSNAQEFAQDRINYLKGLSVSDKYVIKLTNQEQASDRKKLTEAEIVALFQSGGEITRERIQKLARSSSEEDRQYAAELILHTNRQDSISLLTELLSDSNTIVRLAAIQTASQKYNNEIILALIDNLNVTRFSIQAANALLIIGERAISMLDNAFYRTGQSQQTMIKILKIMGKIGGVKAKESLWNKIDYPDKGIGSQVLLSLGASDFKAGISQISRIKFAIESDIGDITWNLAAIDEVKDTEYGKVIKQALKEEITNDVDHMYMLLSMLYDSKSIQLVKENIESGTTEGNTYALELLDVFLSEQLKQRVIPVLEDSSEAEKARKLELFYPRVKLDDRLVLKFLINRDFTQTNRWTKALVIRQIGILKLKEFSLDLIAQIFNSDDLIVEEASLALFNINQDLFFENIERLPGEKQRQLKSLIVNPEKSHQVLKLDRILFLKAQQQFEGVSGLTLSYLVDITEIVYLTENDILDDNVNNSFYLTYSGTVIYTNVNEGEREYKPGQFIGEMLTLPQALNSHSIKTNSECILLKFEKDQYYDLVSDNLQLADLTLKAILY